MRAALFFLGGMRLHVPQAARTQVLDLCLCLGCSYADFEAREDGSILFTLPSREAKRLLRAAEARGISLAVVSHMGLFALWRRLLRRPGLLLGVLLGLFLLFLSGQFVWAVEVTGNENLSDGEVRQLLRDADFGVGSYLPAHDLRALSTRVLTDCDQLSWLSVYVKGTVAYVQVIEAEPPSTEESKDFAHLVAAVDGQIEYVELFRGVRLVTAGQAVRAGEVLISGIYEGESPRCTRAAGRVMARTERVLEVFVPYNDTETVRGEAALSEISLHFFNFSMKIFENCRNETSSCDIIETEKVLPPVGGRTLPVSLTVAMAYPVQEVAIRRSEREAVSLAYEELSRQLAAISSDVTVLSKRVTSSIEGEGVRLCCTLALIEDIARVETFDPETLSGE